MGQEHVELRGITWDHSRALPPLVATAQRFEELHPHVRIRWEKRSLHDFGHADVKVLAEQFDIVVMDHPWAGFAIDQGVFVNLHRHAEPGYLDALRGNAVGASLASYLYAEQWIALPVDAASPAASFRPDMLSDDDVPRTWDELIKLASRGRVVMPAFHVDLLLHLVMLAATLDDNAASLFDSDETWADADVLSESMDRLEALARHVPRECFAWNPIAVYEAMTRGDDFAYCPFAYTYNNYARAGYARRRLRFADVVELPGCGMLRGVIGGTGLALSARCRAIEPALQYMRYTAAGDVQRTTYTFAGGQPAHRQAWEDESANALTDGFFRRTRNTIERAYLRPRYHGFPYFQEKAGEPLAAWLRGELARAAAVERMNGIYRQSRTAAIQWLGRPARPSSAASRSAQSLGRDAQATKGKVVV